MKNIPPYDPKVRSVIHEIESVLKKHDVAGAVILANGEGNSEYRLFIDTPTWSTIRFVKDGEGIHMQVYAKSKPIETGKTVNMIVHFKDQLGENFMRVDKIGKMMHQHLNIETDRGETYHGPYDDEPKK